MGGERLEWMRVCVCLLFSRTFYREREKKNLKSRFLYRQCFLCLRFLSFLPVCSMKPTRPRGEKSLLQQRQLVHEAPVSG